MPEHMKAWRMEAPGRLEETMKLVADAPRPAEMLESDQILIRVASASLNPADYKLSELGLASKTMKKYPCAPGMDLSGQVVATAEGVSNVKVGDLVLARLDIGGKQGSLSDYVIATRGDYALLPPGFDLDDAAGAPTGALTACQSMVPYVKAGDKIFINGGSGGVGTFAIQIAKALGCHVTVTCSTEKKALCESIGADEVIDYKTTNPVQELKKDGQSYKLVIDTVGTSPPNLYKQSSGFLLPEGVFVQVGLAPGFGSSLKLMRSMMMPSFMGGGKNRFKFCLAKNNHEDIGLVSQWLAQGKVKTVIDSTFEFEEGQKAYAHLRQGRAGGKVIVHVNKI